MASADIRTLRRMLPAFIALILIAWHYFPQLARVSASTMAVVFVVAALAIVVLLAWAVVRKT